MKIDHIGYLSANIEKSIDIFRTLGYTQVTEVICDDIEYEGRPSRMINLCFLENDGMRIELVSPIDETSDVYKTLKRQGEGPYHICYKVDNLHEQIDKMKKESWLVLKKPEMAVAFDYSKVAFLFKKSVGLIELVENKEGCII